VTSVSEVFFLGIFKIVLAAMSLDAIDSKKSPKALPPDWLLDRLHALEGRIQQFAHGPVTLVIATKSADVALMQTLCQAGVNHFGENRLQDALSKQAVLLDGSIHWHLIGHLQGNKTLKAIEAGFSLIHSIDSEALALRVHRHAMQHGCRQSVLMQVNISQEATKYGFTSEALEEAFERLVKLDGLAVEGLMTMAPAQASSEERLAVFTALRELRDRLQAKSGHPLPTLSMGMSDDYLEALQAGSTMIRLGRALLQAPEASSAESEG
jgi:pyridoxal phosphate enzyme (YggS family)